MCQVTILLATYNGSKYIRQMIDSVLAQDYKDFHLVLSDDQSKDDTAQILEEYARKFPETVTHHCSGRRFGNAQDHFMYLLQQFHDSPYMMFCDQDDYWHPDKVSRTLEKMRQIEKSGIPAMVHTDLRVVDGELAQMDASFMHFSKLRGDRLSLRQLLVQNVVTGCTMMINRALAEVACERMPQGEILMHDWWLALIAAAMGTTGYLDEATIDYRQHGSNVVGAKNTRSLSYVMQKIKNDGVREAMRQTYLQAQAFERCFGHCMDEQSRSTVHGYAAMLKKNAFMRRVSYLKHGYLKCGIQRVAAQMIWG